MEEFCIGRSNFADGTPGTAFPTGISVGTPLPGCPDPRAQGWGTPGDGCPYEGIPSKRVGAAASRPPYKSYRRDTPPGVSGPRHQQEDQARFSVSLRGFAPRNDRWGDRAHSPACGSQFCTYCGTPGTAFPTRGPPKCTGAAASRVLTAAKNRKHIPQGRKKGALQFILQHSLLHGTPGETRTHYLALRRIRKNLKNSDKIFLLSC